MTDVDSVINTKKNEIITHLNKKFNFSAKEYVKVSWALKGILSAKGDNYYSEKFADLEFSFKNNNSNNIGGELISHKKITLDKNDVQKFIRELSEIKENLKNISEIK